MSNITRPSRSAVERLAWIALLFFCSASAGFGADNGHLITVMTRNMDAGTDLGYLFAGTDQNSFIQGMAATLAELKDARFRKRAELVADEVAAVGPDLIALQEVTLWRTGVMMQPPATDILYDQLDHLMSELRKRNLHYGVVAVQAELDAEAPVPTAGIDLRMTDHDVILARLDRPHSEFDIFSARTSRYQAVFSFGNDLIGEIPVPCGWLSADVMAGGTKFRFINTHLQAAVPSGSAGEIVQRQQADELLAYLAAAEIPIVLAGDFNSNAEPGPEYTGTAQRIVAAGFTDAWSAVSSGDPGYTWPLFGEDQNSGPAVPNERIDLVFVGGPSGQVPAVLSAVRTGLSAPFASDHAGVVVRLQLQ